MNWPFKFAICLTVAVEAALAQTSLGATELPALPLVVTRLLGATSEREIFMNRTVPWAGVQLGGVHVDRSKTPNRFYVVDSCNNRILGFYGYREPRADGTFPRADLVIGQPTLWDHGSANGDSSQYAQPTDRTLALIPYPYQISTAEGGRSCFPTTDAQGNLYVPDLNNNRILKFNDPFATDAIADDVWGQTSFTNRTRLRPPTASSLFLEWSEEQIFTAGVDVDAAGNLWVADCGNSRVLRFPPGSKTANLVLGQTSFTTWNVGYGLNQMRKPNAVRVHPATGELFVLDGETSGECRMLVFRPPFTTGMSAARQFGKAQTGDQSSGLYWARGFVLDPNNANVVWVADGGNNRILEFNTGTGTMLDVIGFTSPTQISGDGQYVRYNGVVENLHQPDGVLGLDALGNLFFTTTYMDNHVRRVPVPLQRDGQGRVKLDGELLQTGWNQMDGRTVQDHYGMAYASGQLYTLDGPFRMLAWTNFQRTATFQSADFVVGQGSFAENDYGGTFSGYSMGPMSAGNGWLFVASDSRIFVFRTPLTQGGQNLPPVKLLDRNSSFAWDDNGTPVDFRLTGLCYDSSKNALWISDADHNRVLRVRDPAGTAPRVDLVIGQTSKTASAPNHGRGLASPDGYGFGLPWTLALDKFGNLYVVDAKFEGGGNQRAVRYDAASVAPVPGNLFPNPCATGVFCKPDLSTDSSWDTQGGPNNPTFVAFDSQNHMILLAESYANAQFHRAYYYPTPHLGLVPQPTHRITNAFGQAALAIFDERDNLIIQDHTWNRILFFSPSSNAPLVAITNRVALISATATNLLLSGTNGPAVVGALTWTTSAGLSGTLPATAAWSVQIPLTADETTLINLNATNRLGVLGSDALSVSRPVLPAPVFVPAGGTYTGQVTVALATFATNVELRYTTDGAEPSLSATRYTSPFPLTIGATLRAKTFQTGRQPSETTPATFQVLPQPPAFSAQPASQRVAVGSNAIFFVSATGTPPLAYQWQFYGTNLPRATNAALILASLRADQAGPYRVVLSAPGGTVASQIAQLDTFIAPPAVQLAPSSQIVGLGKTATLQAYIAGSPPFMGQWYRNGLLLAGVTSPTLTLLSAQFPDAGQYTFTARNPAGTNSATALLTVIIEPPAVTVSPNAAGAGLDTDVTFTAAASGTAPLSYLWLFQGANLPGATNPVLTLAHLRLADAGVYTVLVSNQVATATAVAVLKVSRVWITPPGPSTNRLLPLGLHGATNRVCDLEISSDLRTWSLGARFFNTNAGGICWLTNELTSVAGRFFRLKQYELADTWLEGLSPPGEQPLRLRLCGAPNARGDLEVSTNLLSWTRIATLTNSATAAAFTNPITGADRLFFRLRRLP